MMEFAWVPVALVAVFFFNQNLKIKKEKHDQAVRWNGSLELGLQKLKDAEACIFELKNCIEELKKNKTQAKESVELQEFLVDLMSGDALVHVKRLAPSDVLLRSPKRG